MRYSQIGNGVISYGTCTPWGDDAMPRGHTGWYPFHGLVRIIYISANIVVEITNRIAAKIACVKGPRGLMKLVFFIFVSLSHIVRYFWNSQNKILCD